jgi:hypothetical protein
MNAEPGLVDGSLVLPANAQIMTDVDSSNDVGPDDRRRDCLSPSAAAGRVVPVVPSRSANGRPAGSWEVPSRRSTWPPEPR